MATPADTPSTTRRRNWREHLRRPPASVRVRLTALYGSLFVLAGAGLVTVTNVLVRVFAPSTQSLGVPAIIALVNGSNVRRQFSFNIGALGTGSSFRPTGTRVASGASGNSGPSGSSGASGTARALSAKTAAAPYKWLKAHPPKNAVAFRGAAVHIVTSTTVLQHQSDQNALLFWSIVAFCVMAVLSVALAWWLAGRALRPLRQMTVAANTISATNLHQRLELAGPDDELKRLAETFNGLLGRLEVAFEAQRRFVVNASHELRTPLARQRAVAEVAMEDPDATVESLRASYARVIAAGEQEERLIAALLLLARSDRGIEQKSPVDLDEIVRRTVASFNPDIQTKQLRLETSLAASSTMGDPQLVERLVANLVENAIVHNTRRGYVKIATASDVDGTRLTIANSGEPIPQDDVERLLRPFERAAGARTSHNGRIGLGLSIVDAIVRAHGGSIRVLAREEGGLDITVELPRDPSPVETEGSDTTS
jgi:signal transduction histidine kinase